MKKSTRAVTHNKCIKVRTYSMIKLKMADNNKPDEDISDENIQIMDYTC